MDLDGHVVIHPDPETQGRVLPQVEPVRTQLAQKDGYLAYTWQNSFEPLPLPKALNMRQYPRYGWIISASSYRQDFVELIDPERLARTIDAYSLEAESYSVVIDNQGVFESHPVHPGPRISEFFQQDEADRSMQELFSAPHGQLRYSWAERPGERRLPQLMFHHYPGELVGHIRKAINGDGIENQVDSDEVLLEIQRAVPCGLIINELVTNALQHAFRADESGTIRVAVSRLRCRSHWG